MKKILFLVSAILIFCCIILLILQTLDVSKFGHFFRNLEFPLGGISYVYEIGEILYVASNVYPRMQVYDLQGNFLNGFFIGGRAVISFYDNVFHITNGHVIYMKIDLQGNVIKEKKINSDIINEIWKMYPENDNSNKIIKYNIFTNNAILKTSKGLIKINPPWYFYIFTAPFPFAIYWIVFGISFFPTKKIIKKKLSNFFSYKPKYLIRR
jgi:uncharacterized integral membrane protein